jgi:hypothetical protein
LAGRQTGQLTPRELLGDFGEDVDDGGVPVEAAGVDEAGGEVAGDDRFLVDFRHGEDFLLVAFAEERRAVEEQAAKERVVGVFGKRASDEGVEKLVLVEVDPLGDLLREACRITSRTWAT